MFKGVLLHQAPNCSVPDSLIEKTVKDNPTGVATVIIHNNAPVDMLITPEEGYGEAGVKEFLQTFREQPIWLHFLNHQGAQKEDYQPYKVLSDGNNFVLMMADGDFSQFHKTDGSHPDAFYAAQDYFLPKLSDFFSRYDDKNKNIKTLMSYLNGATVWKIDTLNTFQKGVLLLIGSNGEYIRYPKGDCDHTFSWGWTTTPYDYKETGYPQKETVVEKTKSMAEKMKAALGVSKAPSSSVPAVPKVQPAATTATAIPAGGQTNDQLVEATFEDRYPPTHFDQHRTRKGWYKNTLKRSDVKLIVDGKLVDWIAADKLTNDQIMKVNDGRGIGVRVPVKSKVKSLSDIGSLAQSTPAAAAKTVETNTAARGKDTSTKHIASTTPLSVPGQVTDKVLPILSEKQQQAVDNVFKRDDVKKMLDMSSKKVPFDPTNGGKEDNYQTFAQSRGLKDTRQLSHLSLKALWDLGKADALALAILCSDWRALAMQYAPAYEVEHKKSAREIIEEKKREREAMKKAS